MKNLWSLIGAAGMLIAPNLYAGFDGTIQLFTGGAEQSGNGGAFDATTTSLAGPALGNFRTFCIEYNEEFNPGAGYTYNYYINTGAVADTGDSGSAAAPVYGHIDAKDSHTGGNMDNISVGTAWLYSQYRAGVLSGYNYGTTKSGGNLQNAIWYLEGEITLAQLNGLNGNDGTAFVNEAKAGALADGKIPDAAHVFDDSNGAYGVVALNLYYANGARAQDQLAIVPEPSTMLAGGLLLLPFAGRTVRRLHKARVV